VRRFAVLLVLAAVALAVLLGAPFVGPTEISLESVLQGPRAGGAARIFWTIRVPRVAVAFLAGMGLAVSGMAFQAMFRNPLATPFTLGVASGASLGAAAYLYASAALAVAWPAGLPVAAFCGALAAVGLVYGLTRLRKGFATDTLLLAGVAVAFFFSSLIVCLQYLSDPFDSFRILRWLMGGLSDTVGYRGVWTLGPLALLGSALIGSFTRELNLLTTGEDLAASRGVAVGRVKHLLFFGASLTVGGVVSVCGPIGFVGLMSPHICRLLTGPDHRTLTPATLLFGGAFLVVCDTLARAAFPLYSRLTAGALDYTEVPVGVITALLGGPFFLYLLLRGGRRAT